MARLVSLNVGLPRDVAWKGQTVYTAVWKQPVAGRAMVRRLNVDGDGQGDLGGHGGEHRAVMVYQMESYRHWETHFGRRDFAYGYFGENFTVDGLPDDHVCIGDRYRVGGALLEVTQPRVTCYRVGIRTGEPEMPALLVAHHRPGFYFRVLEEGEVGAGDEIAKVSDGPERMTVAEIDALLYLPSHTRERLESSLRIPALSPGWQGSLRAILERGDAGSGNAGLTTLAGPPPAWSGFRALRVARVERESTNVRSLWLEPVEGAKLPAPLPGQFVVLKLATPSGGPSLLRNYSLSGAPDAGAYRVSIKREAHGAASSYVHDHVAAGDVLPVSAPRGAFTLQPGDGPVVLLSAGIGATPVLAMLHALAAGASVRQVWWLHGARNRSEHAFADEARGLIQSLAHGFGHVVYSKPEAEDQAGVDFDSAGHMDMPLIEKLGVAPASDFYLCGPQPFLNTLEAGLKAWGAVAGRVHAEVFGAEEAITPGIAKVARPAPHPPEGTPGTGPLVSFTRSGVTVPWDARFESLLELAEACDVPARWSCRTGVCHTCESTLIGGSLAYRPEPLEPPAEGNLLICCSRPLSGVEIDL